MLKGILIGLFLVGCGGAIIYYHASLLQIVGSIGWGEKYLGSSKAALILIGFVLIVLGIMMMFGFGVSDPTDTQSIQLNT